MRPATIDLESSSEILKAILNAETEEEIIEIKEHIRESLRKNEASEEYIQTYMIILDQTIDAVEQNEIVLDENGQFVRNSAPTQESIESDAPQTTMIDSQANTKAGIGLGLVGASLVTCLALKKRIFKNKKNKTL